MASISSALETLPKGKGLRIDAASGKFSVVDGPFDLSALLRHVGCKYVALVPLNTGGHTVCVDEEGALRGAIKNDVATAAFGQDVFGHCLIIAEEDTE